MHQGRLAQRPEQGTLNPRVIGSNPIPPSKIYGDVMYDTVTKYDELIGKTFTCVNENGDTMTFKNDTDHYVFMHHQDCCESVSIEDISGDLKDLQDSPILEATCVTTLDKEVAGVKDMEDYWADELCEWSFYKFSTIKGSVTVRWFGTSNGYYSVRVDFVDRNKPDSYLW